MVVRLQNEGSDMQSDRPSLFTRLTAHLTLLALVIQTTFPTTAMAATVVDTAAAAGKKAIIEKASNGAEIVHIAPPSAMGVSQNLYKSFDVSAPGMVLNNSSANSTSQLAGAIKGNVQLGGSAARLIVNQVTGTAASSLLGKIEVAGTMADVVVANPNGITCDGCGFINTRRGSFVTGQAVMSGADLGSFNVTGGQIDVTAKGLNAQGLVELDLLAGRLSVGGSVVADQIFAITGPNTVSYGTLDATSVARVGTKPTVAIDMVALGSMQAGAIYLLATEQGVGVNAAGRLTAGTGGLQLNANGSLTLAGTQTATGNVVVAAQSIEHKPGATQSTTGSVLMSSTGAITFDKANVAAGADVMLSSAGAGSYTRSVMDAKGDMRVLSAAALNITAGSYTAAGEAMFSSVGDLNFSPLKITDVIAITGGTRTIDNYDVTLLDAKKDVFLQSSSGVVSLDGSYMNAGGSFTASGQSVGLLGPKDLLREQTYIGGTTAINTKQTLVAGSVNAQGDIALMASGNAAGTTDETKKGDIFMVGGLVRSQQGHVSLTAQRDIDVANDVTTDTTFSEYYKKRRRLFSTKVERVINATSDQTIKLSEVSGTTVSMGAGNDLNIIASNVQATGSIGLHADHDLNLLSTGEIDTSYNYRYVKKSGIFSSGGFGITIGSQSRTEITSSRSVQQTGASVSSLLGDVMATAGNQYTQLSSEIIAPTGDVGISAKEVAIQTNNNTLSVMNSIRQTQSGITLSASHPLISAAQTVVDMEKAKQRTSSGHTQALAMLTSALTAYNAYNDLTRTTSADPAEQYKGLGSGLGNWTLSLSVGSSSSSFESIYQSSLPQESSILAGGNLSVSATGAASASLGDISIMGSALSAGKALRLQAENDIFLVAATGKTEESTRTKASSAAIGLSLSGQSGLSVTLAASRTRGFTNGWGTTYYPVALTAGINDANGQLILSSGRHTQIKGATVSGHTVQATVGTKGSGDLLMVSPQDESHYVAQEKTMGFNISIPVPGLSTGAPSGSVSYNQLKLLADYQSAREQTAIRAGLGGFAITVNGNTHLKGAAIASAAEASKNTLTTQTLTYSDMLNGSNVKGSSTGLTLSYDQTKVNTGALANSAYGFAQINRSSTGHTKAAVSPGSIVITKADQQAAKLAAVKVEAIANIDKLMQNPGWMICTNYSDIWNPGCVVTFDTWVQDCGYDYWNPACDTDWNYEQERLFQERIDWLNAAKAAINATNNTLLGLSRDVNAAHKPVAPTFNAQQATADLKAGVAVTAAFGRAGYKAAGDYAKARLDEATALYAQAKETADATKKASLMAQADALNKAWKDGGSSRAILHAVIGGAAYGLKGSVSAAANQLAEPTIKALLAQQGVDINTASGNLLKLAASTALGAAVGGVQGGSTVFNADTNNRQLHPDVQKFVTNNLRVQRYAQQRGLSYTAAEDELIKSAAVLNDEGWSKIHGSSATEAARQFLLKESVGLRLSDGSGYFTPSAQDYKDASKFVVEALSGDGQKLYVNHLAVQPDALKFIGGSSVGILTGSWQALKNAYQDLTQMPESLKALYVVLDKARNDPIAAAASIKMALERLTPEALAFVKKQEAMVTLLDMYGDYSNAQAAAIVAGFSVADPLGKFNKGGKAAKMAADSLGFAGSLMQLEAKIGTKIPLPDLTLYARNDGILAENIAKQATKELGLEFKVLQNNSKHGVDLYAYDPVKNQYIVVEVKSSTVGSFGAAPADGPAAFLKSRAEKAAAGQGVWDPKNTPLGMKDAGQAIKDQLDKNAPTVVGYKFEVALPKANESGTPTLNIKKWEAK